MFDELGVGNAIDAVIAQNVSQRKVTIGQSVNAMVVNGLGFANHRPELKQFGLQLIVESEAGIPMMMAALSGNDNDKTVFRDAVSTHVRQLQEDHGTGFLAADSALYTTETIKRPHDLDWVTRVPETIELARTMIADLASDWQTGAMESVRPSAPSAHHMLT